MSELTPAGNVPAACAAIARSKRVVVKVGTTTLTYPNGRLNLRRIERLCTVLSDLSNQGRDMILVTSGAVAVGADRLGLPARPRDTVGKQAASAVGQAMLMQIYQRFFTDYNQEIAQLLLTKSVVEHEESRANARNTLRALREMRVIPLVNANDSVSTDELGFSENDTLSAYVAVLSESDLLVNLSDTDGMYDADPKLNPNARLITEVAAIDARIEALAGASSSALGSGGMVSKVAAARLVTAHGIPMVIAAGEDPGVLWRLLAGEPVGTLFLARNTAAGTLF